MLNHLVEGAMRSIWYQYKLPERDVAPLKGIPVVPGGVVVPGGGVVGGGAFVAGPPTELVRAEMHCNDYVVAKILSGSEHS